MTFGRLSIAVNSLALLGLGLAPSARADQWDKKTVLTVSQSIQVPNKLLPPGKYVFTLLNSLSDRHIMQIFNEDEPELQATILAIPNYRLRPAGGTVITFREVPPVQPATLRAWSYPGDNFGQEFAYPKLTAVTIAEETRTDVPPTEPKAEHEIETAPIAEVTPQRIERPVPAPEVAAVPALPVPEPAVAPAELPHTAKRMFTHGPGRIFLPGRGGGGATDSLVVTPQRSSA